MQAGRQADRQADRQAADRQTGSRQTDRQCIIAPLERQVGGASVAQDHVVHGEVGGLQQTQDLLHRPAGRIQVMYTRVQLAFYIF